VSQIGYMILGLALYTPLAIVGAVFYLVHHIIVKANLFLVSGVAHRLTGSTDLNRIGGLYKSSPLLAVLFLVPAFSLAGFPPLSGFWAKYLLVKASLDLEAWFVAFVALARGPAHHLLHDEDLGRGVLEAASRRDRAAGDGAAPRAALAADAAHRGACGADRVHRAQPRALRAVRRARGRPAPEPGRLRDTVLGAQP
jgi:hypothetical protein